MSRQDASTGVQALIDRLREKGVAAGQQEAERIVTNAREEAERIVARAREQAEAIVTEAQAEARRVRESGEAAVALAARDAQLELREALMTRFVTRIRHLVGEALEDRDLLHRLVLAVGGRLARGEIGDEPVEVLLPADAIDLDDVKRAPDQVSADALSQLVRGVTADLLREGVELRPGGAHRRGLVVGIRDGSVAVDLTDEAVSELLVRHLRPRFRALIEGVLR